MTSDLKINMLDTKKANPVLSYRWGPSFESEIIVINGTATSAGRILALALRHVRAVIF
jgi:hypothetical protein